MVALFVVPAFCTKSGYIYKNKGGGQLNQNQTKSKLQLSSARKVIQVQITLLGSSISWVSKKWSFGRWSVRWDNHEELIQAGGAAR